MAIIRKRSITKPRASKSAAPIGSKSSGLAGSSLRGNSTIVKPIGRKPTVNRGVATTPGFKSKGGRGIDKKMTTKFY